MWGGTQWRSWLRHCAASRKVAGSIPVGITGIFHWHNPSGRTMALELTQPLTEMSTRNIYWGLRRPVRKADNLTTFMCRFSWNLGASNSWNPQGLSRPVMGLLYILHDTWTLMKYYAAYGVAIPYWRFGTNYWYHLQGNERLFRNVGNELPPYGATEERRSHHFRGGSLKRRMAKCMCSAKKVNVENKWY